MDYIRIRHQVAESPSHQDLVAELTIHDIKELLKDWIKLYPNSFAPDVEFKIFQLENSDIIIQLHDDMSSLAVSLLILYLGSHELGDSETRRLGDCVAYITIDDTEVLLKQNEGKRAMIVGGQQTTDNGQQSSSTSVRFILEDNYCLDYNFEKRAKPVKDSDIIFNEEEISLPENYETVRVGDVVKNKVDKVLEEEGLTPRKMLIYLLCGAIGLSIGFLIVYFMSR